jgi:murein DD-endopeptidase MepM/ murein hydrolase activator NlpD
MEFSPYLKDFYNKQKGINPATMQGASSPSTFPTKIYKNLNTDISSLGVLTTDFGGSTRYEKFHPAIDIANKIGTPIPAFRPGTVVSVSTGKKQGDKGYGNNVIVVDASGNKHRYSHLQRIFVKIGQKVGAGEQLATMGNTGSTYSNSGGTGSHLDYRITDAYNKAINPYVYLKKSI